MIIITHMWMLQWFVHLLFKHIHREGSKRAKQNVDNLNSNTLLYYIVRKP